jgi:hypothetical protein
MSNDMARRLAELERRLKSVERSHSLKRSPVYQGPPTLAPERLTVGIVGNLVQDPAFQTAIRSPLPADWVIMGPDIVYTDSNFLRCTHAGLTIEFDPGDSYLLEDGTGSYELEDGTGLYELEPTIAVSALPLRAAEESAMFLTDFIAVDPGRTVRIAAQIRRDTDALTTSWGRNVAARVKVIFYKADRETTTSAIDDLDLLTETDADVWSLLEHTFAVPEGYVYARGVIATAFQQQGRIDFAKPEVQLLWNRVQSSTFVEGSAGWALDDRVSQIGNLNVIEDIGVDTLSAKTIFLDGVDLSAESVDTKAKGVIAWDSRATGSTDTGSTSSSTELKVFEFSAGQMFANRLYRITSTGMLNGSVAGDRFALRAKYTLDGSTPGTGSTGVRTLDVEITASTLVAFDYSKIFSIPSDTDNFRVAFTLQRSTGTGVAFIDLSSRGFDMAVEDLGLVADAAATGNLSQKSYADATPPDPDPVRSFTRTWYATWSRSYDGDRTPRSPSTDDLYQGYVSSYHGNTRSLFGFDYSSIQAALSGATITSIKVTYRVKHAWSYAGANVYVSSHSYSSAPSAWNSASVVEDRLHSGGNKEGSTYTKTLPVAVGTEFKNGTTRGLGFGPGPSNSASSYYAYMYGGDSSSSRPRITITYTK